MASGRGPGSKIPTFSQKKREGIVEREVAVKRRRIELTSSENVPPAAQQRFKPKARMRRSVSMSTVADLMSAEVAGINKNPRGLSANILNTKQLPARPPGPTRQTSAVAPAPGAKVSTKRPGWDLRGQIQDMQGKLMEERSRNALLMEQQRCVESKYLASASRCLEVDSLLTNKEITINNLTKVITQKEIELQEAIIKLKLAEGKIQLLESETECLKSEIASKTCSVDSLTTMVTSLQKRKYELEDELKFTTDLNNVLNKENALLEERVSTLTATAAQQLEQLRAGEMQRRQMHNTIQDLKGTIRVFCRVRPLLAKEAECNMAGCIGVPDRDGRTVVLTQAAKDVSVLNESTASTSTNNGGNHMKTHEFSFDRVFSTTSSQSEVFQELSQLVQSALDGYNVCIFAYGPTGSGKTYTMEGGVFEDPSDPTAGMIPRGVEQVFSTVKILAQQGWKYTVEASFLEIYNETIRDLLTTKSDKKYEVKLGRNNEVYVSNLTKIVVEDHEKVYELLGKAQKNRAVAETNCNERSSRSHTVFTLCITGNNNVTGDTCKAITNIPASLVFRLTAKRLAVRRKTSEAGTLNLVDLAGSERLKSSGSEGERLREAKNINKSLSNLGNVILALGQKNDHIPYRNSKLTYLLMNSLGGNSKTLMFINVSPSDDHYYETLNSLRFAKTVNECYVGVATKRK